MLRQKPKFSIPAKIRHFLRDESGVAAIVFAMALPMLIGAGGMAVDLAQAYNAKNRLSAALDKAALAGGSTDGTEAQIKERVTKFFHANYPTGKIGEVYDLTVLIGNDATVTVTAHSKVETMFMSALGTDYMDIYAESKVKRELAGVEVVLVLDVTGSMDDALGTTTKIKALKTAVSGSGLKNKQGVTVSSNSSSFLNILFTRISDKNYLKIGIVPFSNTVNVGPYGLGKTPTGATYGTPFVDRPATDNSEGAGYSAYVTPASNIQYQAPATSTTNWWGCIRERASPNDVTDASSPNWGMYRYPKICSSVKNGTCQSWSNQNPNVSCPQSSVVPLMNDKTALVSSVDNLITGGSTYGSVGMAWGYHLITPSAPFTEGVALNDPNWSKTVIFMSDGDNNANSTYSAYGPNSSITDANIDTKFVTACNNMKAEGITIYTISFGTSVSTATKNMFKACASDVSKYFNSTSGTDLSTAFNAIANQLSSLHIVE